MNSSQIRHQNFHTLSENFIAGYPEQPHRGMLRQFAQQMGLPQGWMDREHDASRPPLQTSWTQLSIKPAASSSSFNPQILKTPWPRPVAASSCVWES
jgi:hypothetical protein